MAQIRIWKSLGFWVCIPFVGVPEIMRGKSVIIIEFRVRFPFSTGNLCAGVCVALAGQLQRRGNCRNLESAGVDMFLRILEKPSDVDIREWDPVRWTHEFQSIKGEGEYFRNYEVPHVSMMRLDRS